jgi:predicted ATPase
MLKALEAARVGNGGTVLLSGEPGIGKTRLAREVLARAAQAGARTCVGRCFEQHTAVPFFPFIEAFTLPLGGAPLLPDVEALERWPELAHLLPETAAEPSMRPISETQLQIFRAVTALLRACAEVRPLILLLDDLHWADVTRCFCTWAGISQVHA